MWKYHRILLAVDLSDNSLEIGQRARLLAAALDAELEIVHIVEPVPIVTPIPPEPVVPEVVATELELADAARAQLTTLAAELAVPDIHCHVEIGNIKTEILRFARELSADLIVLGARERHGLSVLVPFVEDTVLHAAPCDVLAVRVKSSG